MGQKNQKIEAIKTAGLSTSEAIKAAGLSTSEAIKTAGLSTSEAIKTAGLSTSEAIKTIDFSTSEAIKTIDFSTSEVTDKKMDQTNQKMEVIDKKLNIILPNLKIINKPVAFLNAYNFVKKNDMVYIYEITYNIDIKRKDDTEVLFRQVADNTFWKDFCTMIRTEEYLINDDKPEDTTYVLRILTINNIDRNTLNNILNKDNYVHKGSGSLINKLTGRDIEDQNVNIKNITSTLKFICTITSDLSIDSFDQIYKLYHNEMIN
jgi:hypothetical protein